MPAVILVGAAVGVRQWLTESKGRRGPVLTDGGATFAVDGRIGTGGRTGQQFGEVGLEFLYLLVAERTLKNVEATPPVGRVDFRVKASIVREPNRSTVAKFERPGPPRPEIVVHGGPTNRRGRACPVPC